MALAPYALATLAEFKDYITAGDGKTADARLEAALGRASLEIEAEGLGGRRGIYRGPVESYTSIVNGATAENGALTIAGPPSSSGRTLIVRKNDADRSITRGTLTITQASPALSETFDLSTGDELHGVKFFTSTVTATLTNLVGAGVGDTIDVGTSEGYTEFYSPCGGSEVKPEQYPIRYLHAVWEDYNHVFGSDTLLVVGTDYELRSPGSPRRSITRLSGVYDWSWQPGRRTVKAQMSAGWIGTAGVPRNVKDVCLELAAWYWQHTERNEYGMQSRTDAMGSVTRTGPPMLTTGMKNSLGSEWRPDSMPTCERGWVDA